MTISEFCSRVWRSSRTVRAERGIRIVDLDDIEIVVSEVDYATLLAEFSRHRENPAVEWSVDAPPSSSDSLAMTLRVFGLPVRPSRDLTDGTIKVRAEVDA